MKLKKFMSVIMAVVAASTFCTISALAGTDPEVKLTTAATAVKAGEQFTVDVSIANNPGIVSLYLNVDATNDNFTLVSVEDKKMSGVAGILDTDYTKSEYMLQWWYDDTFSTDNTSNGTVATLTYKVNEGVADGTYAINIACDADNTYCAAGDPVDFGSYALEVEVGEPAPTTETKYFAASFVPGIKSAANNAIEFSFKDGDKEGKKAVYYGDVVMENLESVVTAVEVTEVPEKSALELVGTAWTTIVK